jgi:tRNA dimethylallyltransferase
MGCSPRPPDGAAPLLVLAGPTGSGKSAASVPLAAALDAEIVSFDSMAVYRGMDVGTAKPSLEARARVRHHLIDVVDPVELWSVGEHLRRAEAAFEDIRSRGMRALVVGGTFLYLRALLYGLEDSPRGDPRRREEWVERERVEGPGTLHRILLDLDPVAAARLHPHDVHRLVRALEKAEASTRRAPADASGGEDSGGGWSASRPARAVRLAVLVPPTDVLVRRVEERVRAMFAGGLVDEARRLSDLGLSRTAREAIGYREALAVAFGERDEAEAVRETVRRTKILVRRQRTWLRSFPQARDLPLTGDETAEDVAVLARGILDP